MKAELRATRKASWAYGGIARVGDHFAELRSVNERRIFQAMRLAAGIEDLRPKPLPMVWSDFEGRERRYSADARAKTTSGDTALLEFKPLGLLRPGSSQLAIYEDIGRFLRESCKFRFGLVEWDRASAFSRNLALLTRYTDVEPGRVAADAFDELDLVIAPLGDVMSRVSKRQLPAFWAGLAHQRLCADLRDRRLSRDTLVSRPGEAFKPLVLDDFVSTWWA